MSMPLAHGNDSFAVSFVAPPRLERTTLAAIAFFALVFLVFVGLQPFVPPHSGAPLAAASATDGDFTRQIFYLGIFAVVLVSAVQRRGLGAIRAMPLLLGLLLAWCLLSAFWATAHGVAFRRATLEAVLALSILLSADTIGPERAFRYLRIVLAAILVVNWISIPLVATAVHLPGEIDPGLVGDWRGLYGEKNAAGATCALTALLFLFTRNGRYNWIGGLAAAASLAFLVMTHSKTSLALFPVALLAGLAYRVSWRDGLSRTIFAAGAALLLLAAGAVLVTFSDGVSRILEDPAEFTGRAEIWQAYFAFVSDHPWLGAGFGAIGDSHDGYLQLLVTLGWVGFVLAMLGLVVEPLVRLWPLDYQHQGLKALLFALFVFIVLHNFMQSDFLASDDGVWFSFLLVIAALRNPDKSLTLAP
ncbi:MAG TPA: O-antigen ligase family protein [Rhizomicrobium sp.]|jgi:exopolysaccharide production protein ExoQ|nr:O-antigen ligase family protein [Rhizomicrobium sp.]